MAAGTQSDFQIYNEQYYSGVTETLTQNANIFNGASGNALQMVPQRVKGQFEQASFIQLVANLDQRRDTTSVSAVTDKKLEQDEEVGVKLNRRLGPVAQTDDAWRKIAASNEELSLILGRQSGVAIAITYANSLLRSLVACMKGNSGIILDKTDESTAIDFTYLNEALELFGDRAGRVITWVMHSKPYFRLVSKAITDKITDVANMAIYNGTTGTLGRPVVVSDSSALYTDTGGSNNVRTYHILGLVQGAGTVKQSEEQKAVLDSLSGYENLMTRFQGEYAFNVSALGYGYKTTAGANPNDATLGVSASWEQVVTDDKDTAGVMLNVSFGSS